MRAWLLSMMLAWPAAASAADSVARAVVVSGSVTVERVSGEAERLDGGAELYAGDTVRTGASGRLRMLMSDKSVVDLGSEASLQIKGVRVKNKSRQVGLKLFAGRVWAKVSSWFGDDDSSYEIETDNAVAGVRGTELVVDVAEDGSTQVWVLEGRVLLGSATGDYSELITAFHTGSLTGTGIEVAEISRGDFEQMLKATRPPAELGPGGAERRVQTAVRLVREGRPSSTPQIMSERLEDLSDPGGEPPLDIDPGTRFTTVEGRVEVED